MKRPKPSTWPRWVILSLGLLVGALIILAIRLATYSPEHVHYHANFAVYINGQRQEFKSPQYYQEVAVCSSTTGITRPEQRAHMHDNINSVVHIHDHAVTWGQFFANLGWTIGPDFLETDSGAKYVADGSNQLHIILNGQDYTSLTNIANTTIQDRSRLLVSFGNQDDHTLQQQYKTIPSTAKHYDETKDPASCAGDEAVPFSVRLHHLF